MMHSKYALLSSTPTVTINQVGYFNEFFWQSVQFKIGDCAYFRPISDDEHDYKRREGWIAQIEAISAKIPLINTAKKQQKRRRKQDQTAQIQLDADEVTVHIRWLYYPEETVRGKHPFQSSHELLLSQHRDVNSISVIGGKAIAVEWNKFQEYTSKYIKEAVGLSTKAIDTSIIEANHKHSDESEHECENDMAEFPIPNEETGEHIYFVRRYYDAVTRLSRPLTHGELEVDLHVVLRAKSGALHSSVGDHTSLGDSATVASNASKSNEPSSSTHTIDQYSSSDKDPAVMKQRDRVAHARGMLQLSAIPASLPCREKERKQIREFLETSIRNGGIGRALYVSGMPGTGKTATVTEVLRELQHTNVDESVDTSNNNRRKRRKTEASKRTKSTNSVKDLPPFRYLEVNAMKLQQPHQIYTHLYRFLTGRRVGTSHAATLLDQRFGSAQSNSRTKQRKKDDTDDIVTVLIVDELDFLVTKKQAVLYNLFEWPTRPHSRLVVVGIANTMDLPERLLPKVHSRLGMERLIFSPYTRQQLQKIVEQRLESIDLFDSTAISMASRKVSAISGDVRRALSLCRRAAELAYEEWYQKYSEEQNNNKDSTDQVVVKIAHIQAAARALAGSETVVCISKLSIWERCLLSALMLHLRAMRTESAPYESVARRCMTLLQRHFDENVASVSQYAEPLKTLVDLRLVSSTLNKKSRWPVLQLLAQPDDVAFGLRQDKALAPMLDAALDGE